MRRIILPLVITLLSGCQGSVYQGPCSDHFDGKTFYFPGEKDRPKNSLYALATLWIYILKNPWPKSAHQTYLYTISKYPDDIKITHINHSTVLIQSRQITLLIDPIYSLRASPFEWIGPKRVRPPGVHFSDLPKPDAVLISHNHYDHLDIPTLKRLHKTFHPLFIVPLGNRKLLGHYGIHNVIEMDWWQTHRIKQSTVTFLPAHHNTQRGFYDTDRTLWGSWGIKINNKKIYFAGDTGYANHFPIIRSRWGRPDFSFIPIGDYLPRSMNKAYHLNPLEAVRSHLELGSRRSLGIHWGTFQLGSDSIDQPVNDLIQARLQLKVPAKQFFVLPEGKTLNVTPK